MEKEAVSKRIGDIIGEIAKLVNTLYAMDTADILNYAENFGALSTDAALRTEKVTCLLRNLVFATANVRKEDYMVSAAGAQGIGVGYEGGVLDGTGRGPDAEKGAGEQPGNRP